MSARVGVVLSGCGVFDGSEITEAVCILIALDKRQAKITCMAPNIAQSETINHTTKKTDSQSRRGFEEEGRNERGHHLANATLPAHRVGSPAAFRAS